MTGIESKNYSSMTEGKRLVHQVVVPPKDSFAIETGRVVRETFFHDVGPLDWFKGVSRRQQCLLALKYAFPIVDWLSTYKLNTFLYDLLAGVTTASVAIPQVCNYPCFLPQKESSPCTRPGHHQQSHGRSRALISSCCRSSKKSLRTRANSISSVKHVWQLVISDFRRKILFAILFFDLAC